MSEVSAVITGAASGIGLAIARRMAADGYGLHLLDRDPDALRDACCGLGDAVLGAHPLDVRDAEAVAGAARAVVGRHGAPALVVNNAATGRTAALLDTTDKVWDLVLGVDLTGPFLVCRSFLPGMLEAGGGVIVNISSAAALVGLRNRFAYSTAKAGLLGFTRSVAADYGDRGIRCNTICPGTVDTPWNQRVLAAAEDRDLAAWQMHSRAIDGRMGRPEEIAGGVAFLAGPDGRFMNGAVIVMDGGMTIT